MTVECQTCGWSLQVPPGVGEGGEFACGHCGALLRNDDLARAFRWSAVDPYVRRHGASRPIVWGATTLALLCVPAMAAHLHLSRELDMVFLATLTAPWVLIIVWLLVLRGRVPRVRWYVFLWIGLGAYATFVAILVGLIPPWRPLLGLGDNPDALKLLFVLGVMSMMVGVGGASAYRWVLGRTPTARASPPPAL